MIIETALYKELTVEQAAVIAIAGTRGYPVFIPLDASRPAWSYQFFRYPGDLAHDTTTAIEKARVQITCTATTYLVARNLATAIRTALHGFTGEFGGTGGASVNYCECSALMDGYNFNSEKHTVRVDAYLTYFE